MDGLTLDKEFAGTMGADAEFTIEGSMGSQTMRVDAFEDRLQVSPGGRRVLVIRRNESLHVKIRQLIRSDVLQFDINGWSSAFQFSAEDAKRLHDWMGPPTRVDVRSIMKRRAIIQLLCALGLGLVLAVISFEGTLVDVLLSPFVFFLVGLLVAILVSAVLGLVVPRVWQFYLHASIWFAVAIILGSSVIPQAIGGNRNAIIMLATVAMFVFQGIRPIRKGIRFRGADRRQPLGHPPTA